MNSVKIDAKEKIYQAVSAVASSFGSSARLKILHLLSQAPRSVEVIANITGESVANTSQHLRKLFSEGLVEVKKDKITRIYRLKDESIAFIIEQLFDITEKISPEIKLAESELVEEEFTKAIPLHSVIQEIEKDRAVMVDVREEYESSVTHVEGTLSLPLDELKRKAKTLLKSKTYYLFCRGRGCDMATEGVKILRSLGYKAYRLKESPISIKKLKLQKKGESLCAL